MATKDTTVDDSEGPDRIEDGLEEPTPAENPKAELQALLVTEPINQSQVDWEALDELIDGMTAGELEEGVRQAKRLQGQKALQLNAAVGLTQEALEAGLARVKYPDPASHTAG